MAAGETNDYNLLMRLIRERLPDSYRMSVLGRLDDLDIVLVEPKHPVKDRKNVLVISGVHGDEVGGPWSIVRYMEDFGLDKSSVNLSIIPVVNVTAFVRNTRFNRWEERSDLGFFNERKTPSKESKILLDHGKRLLELGRDGVLSVHEDITKDGYYFYLWVKKWVPAFVKKIREVGARNFSLLEDKKYDDLVQESPYHPVDSGVFNNADDDIETWAYLKGTPLVMVSETPVKGHSVADRAETGAQIIDLFIDQVRTMGPESLKRKYASDRIRRVARELDRS